MAKHKCVNYVHKGLEVVNVINTAYFIVKNTAYCRQNATKSTMHKLQKAISKKHKISKTYSLMNKILSLSALLSVYCDLCFLRLFQRQIFFSSWVQQSVKS